MKATTMLRRSFADDDTRHVKIATIQRVVARHYNMTRRDLLSQRRMAGLVRPRHVAIYLARTLTLLSLPVIGRHFGGRDHTSVLHAIRKIDTQLSEDADLAEDVEVLKRQLLELSSCSDQVDSDRALLEQNLRDADRKCKELKTELQRMRAMLAKFE